MINKKTADTSYISLFSLFTYTYVGLNEKKKSIKKC